MAVEIKSIGRGKNRADVRTSDCVQLTIRSNPEWPEQAEWLRAMYRTVSEGKCDEDDRTIRKFFGYEDKS